MTLAALTALMSKVGRKRPELMQDRNVALFIQACIDEAKDMEQGASPARSRPSRS